MESVGSYHENGLLTLALQNKTTLFHLGSMFASLDLSERQVIDPSPLLKKLGLNKQDQQDAAE